MTSGAGEGWREVYRGRRVLVLGATGFIGRWVARALAAAGAELHLGIRDRPLFAEVSRQFALEGEPWECDLTQPGRVGELVAEVRPEVTFNLAGYGIGPGERDPELSERLNGDLVRELCAALEGSAASAWPGVDLVHTGSMLEYGTVQGELRENSPANPTTPYGRSKLHGTQALVRAVTERRLRAVCARLFTVYGPGEMEGRLLPTLLAAARSGEQVPLTAGRQLRDFLHVEEVAEALLRLGAAPPQGEPIVHVGSGTPIQVRDFVVVAARVLGLRSGQLRMGAIDSPWYESEMTSITTDRLHGRTGWLPRITVEEGVARTAEFLGVPLTGAQSAEKETIETYTPPDLSLVLVCGSEGGRLRSFVLDLVRTFAAERIDLELLLVEWRASEPTRQALAEIENARLPVRRLEATTGGYGHAASHALGVARGRFVGWASADGHVDASATARIYQLAAESEAPRLAKVRRRFRLDGWARKSASILYNLTAVTLFGRLGSLDLNGSPKVFPRSCLGRLVLVSDGWFLDTEIVLKARRIGLPVVETNVITQLSHDVLAPVTARNGWALFMQLFAFRLGLGTVARSLRR